MKKNQQGVALVLELLIVAFLLAVIGFVGYRVLKQKPTNSSTTTTTTSTTTSQKTTTKAEPEWKKGVAAISGTFADASVLKINDTTWRMYYSIQPEVKGNNFEVYSSTSTDGKTWTKEAGTRKTMATFPNVVKLADGRYRMYFQSASVLKSAISSDGLTFKDEAGTRIDKSNPDNLAFDNVAAPTVLVLDDGTYMMVYRGTMNVRYAEDTPNATTQVLLWATSSDGLTFTKKGMAVDSRYKTLNGQMDGPDLVKWDDGKLRVYATTYTGIYMFKFDGSKFDTGALAYTTSSTLSASNKPTAPTPGAPGSTPAEPAQVPGDPTLAKIGDTWYMYYGQKDGIHYASLKDQNQPKILWLWLHVFCCVQ